MTVTTVANVAPTPPGARTGSRLSQSDCWSSWEVSYRSDCLVAWVMSLGLWGWPGVSGGLESQDLLC
ncbi:hypothetical protein VCV18_010476 [Metarhizium anisopliae]